MHVVYDCCCGVDVHRQQVQRQRQRLVQRLEALGVKVTLEEVGEAA